MQVNNETTKSSNSQNSESKLQTQKKLVEDLKVEWKQMWTQRYDDKERAEGVSANDYKALYVERGTIIHATKDFKALDFKDILNQHKVENPERYVQPDVNIGGWKRFIRTEVSSQQAKRSKSSQSRCLKKSADKQTKKSERRGWLHMK